MLCVIEPLARHTVGDTRDIVFHLTLTKGDQKTEAFVCQVQNGENLFVCTELNSHARVTQRLRRDSLCDPCPRCPAPAVGLSG